MKYFTPTESGGIIIKQASVSDSWKDFGAYQLFGFLIFFYFLYILLLLALILVSTYTNNLSKDYIHVFFFYLKTFYLVGQRNVSGEGGGILREQMWVVQSGLVLASTIHCFSVSYRSITCSFINNFQTTFKFSKKRKK